MEPISLRYELVDRGKLQGDEPALAKMAQDRQHRTYHLRNHAESGIDRGRGSRET